jgi:hypothetical protein
MQKNLQYFTYKGTLILYSTFCRRRSKVILSLALAHTFPRDSIRLPLAVVDGRRLTEQKAKHTKGDLELSRAAIMRRVLFICARATDDEGLFSNEGRARRKAAFSHNEFL